MKRFVALGFALLLMLMGASFASAAPTTSTNTSISPSTYQVLINGHIVTGDTLTQSNTTLVPFKVIFQALDYTVTYDAKNKAIKAAKDSTVVSLTVGSTKAYVNGKVTQLPVAPKIVNGVTYVPLRFVANASGETVTFDNGYRAIQIGKQIDWKLLKQPSFRNVKWGMTPAQVKKTETEAFLKDNSSDSVLSYDSSIAGLDAILSYAFYDNSLENVFYFVGISDDNSHVQDYKLLVDYLTQQYGEPAFESIQAYKEEGVEHTDEEWQQLIMSDNDEDVLVATWQTVDADISLVVKPGIQEVSDILVSYQSWKHME